MDMARSILGRNLESIGQDGSILPLEGETSSLEESGNAAFALGEFYRATGESQFQGYDIVDLAAKCITKLANEASESESAIGYSALGLLSFGPAKDRNPVWEKLSEDTRKILDRQLLARSDYEDINQIFNIAKAVARFSMGLSKKDETGKLIDRFLERIQQEMREIEQLRKGVYHKLRRCPEEQTPELRKQRDEYTQKLQKLRQEQHISKEILATIQKKKQLRQQELAMQREFYGKKKQKTKKRDYVR